MITPCPISDAALIVSAMTHPKVWPHISDDASASQGSFAPPIGDPLIYLGMFDDSAKFEGLFFLHPHNAICYEVHTALLPSAWGHADECGNLMTAWMFEHTACQRIITNVPENNALALRLAEQCGFERFGVNASSLQRGGKLIDQIMLGISKGSESCQQ